MKRVLAAVVTTLLVVVFALTMTGCDKSGSIKKAFEKAGYEVTTVAAEDSELLKSLLNEEQEKEISKYEVIICKKGIQSATIIKFPSADKIKEVLGEDGYKSAEDKGYVNGNCYLAVPLSLDATKIFKEA